MTDGVPDTNIIKVEANFDAGYDPVEANADRVAVEIDADALGTPSEKFSAHFKANAGMDPTTNYVNEADHISFAGLSHNSIHLTERNIYN